ncbi:hypothetical protein [Nonomuraea sp. NPDC003214]
MDDTHRHEPDDDPPDEENTEPSAEAPSGPHPLLAGLLAGLSGSSYLASIDPTPILRPALLQLADAIRIANAGNPMMVSAYTSQVQAAFAKVFASHAELLAAPSRTLNSQVMTSLAPALEIFSKSLVELQVLPQEVGRDVFVVSKHRREPAGQAAIEVPAQQQPRRLSRAAQRAVLQLAGAVTVWMVLTQAALESYTEADVLITASGLNPVIVASFVGWLIGQAYDRLYPPRDGES